VVVTNDLRLKLGTFPSCTASTARAAHGGSTSSPPPPVIWTKPWRATWWTLHFSWSQLKNNLSQQQMGEAVQQRPPLGLGTLERPAQDSLAIIKRFKQHLRSHFRLDAL
jgi:hypothetical protein